MQLLFFLNRPPLFFVSLCSLDFIIDVQSALRSSLQFARNSSQGAHRALPTYFFCVAESNIELLFCPRTPVLSVIVLEIETGVLAGSFLLSGRLEMSEMSDVSEELRIYAVRESKCWTETEILNVLREVEDYALDSPLQLFCACDKLAEKFRTALKARISYCHLLVQVSKGDRPPKDTSEEEIEEWNASAVIILSVDPGYGTYVRMWKPIPAPWPGSTGSPVAWCLSRESNSPEF